MKNTILLIRSFNRPEYLEKTLQSVLASDIDLCVKRYIYDDGSTDANTLELLSSDEYMNVKGKEFTVIKSPNNYGCKQSYVEALDHIRFDVRDNYQDVVVQPNGIVLNKLDDSHANLLICTIDNDVIVKPDWITILSKEYYNAFNKYNTFDLLLTGFNPTNAHLNIIEDNGTYYRKYTCGGVNFVFHFNFVSFIRDMWSEGLDDRVNDMMNCQGMPLCCLKKSVLNHIGLIGLNSTGISRSDTDEIFHQN